MATKTLGPTSAKFLETVARENKPLVTPADAVRIGRYSPHQAAVFLGQLARRGLLTRLRRGIYCVVPFGKKQEFGNIFLAAHALAGADPHFISHLGAMAFHNMLLHPSRTVHISTTRKRTAQDIGGLRVEFVVVPKKRLWGWRDEWVTDTHRAPVSDIARTLVDGCHRPDLCGGIVEVSRAAWLVKDRVDAGRLMSYVKRLGKFAVAKRLGFILETLKIGSQEFLDHLQKFAVASLPYVNLDPILQPKGRLNSHWRLRLNVTADEITASVRT